MKVYSFKTKQEFADWLFKNYNSETEAWIRRYKKSSGKEYMTYEESVEEALCYGWIDGVTNSYDNESSIIRFTPRKPKSNWSESNILRVERLIKEGRMKEPGLKLVNYAKENGLWTDLNKALEIPEKLAFELNKNPVAKSKFNKVTRSRQMEFINFVKTGKRDETRVARAKKVVGILARIAKN